MERSENSIWVAGWKHVLAEPTVTIDEEKDERAVELKELRLVLALADFVVFHRAPNETLIVKRDAIKRMSLRRD